MPAYVEIFLYLGGLIASFYCGFKFGSQKKSDIQSAEAGDNSIIRQEHFSIENLSVIIVKKTYGDNHDYTKFMIEAFSEDDSNEN